uniref:Uncharacterized protein n=1 Tax=Strigamia maritima TaxID=126957 RepID=T1IUJ9_STRMM
MATKWSEDTWESDEGNETKWWANAANVEWAVQMAVLADEQFYNSKMAAGGENVVAVEGGGASNNEEEVVTVEDGSDSNTEEEAVAVESADDSNTDEEATASSSENK